MADTNRDRGFERLIAFVDAMIAIAITLLEPAPAGSATVADVP